jgi:hypothetical protein
MRVGPATPIFTKNQRGKGKERTCALDFCNQLILSEPGGEK